MNRYSVTNVLLTGALVMSELLGGCSYTKVNSKENPRINTNFPIGTQVFSLPSKNYADSTRIRGYEPDIPLKEITGSRGTVAIEKKFSVRKDLADSLGLPERFPEGYETEIIGSENINRTIIPAQPEKKSQKEWYNQHIFEKEWMPTWGQFGIGAGFGVLTGYLVSQMNNKKSHKPKERPANGGVGGGIIEEGSDIGGVRGGRNDDSNSGSENGGVRN